MAKHPDISDIFLEAVVDQVATTAAAIAIRDGSTPVEAATAIANAVLAAAAILRVGPSKSSSETEVRCVAGSHPIYPVASRAEGECGL